MITITNDGATILKAVPVENPAAKVLVDIAKIQDDTVGDGTTRCSLTITFHVCRAYLAQAQQTTTIFSVQFTYGITDNNYNNPVSQFSAESSSAKQSS